MPRAHWRYLQITCQASNPRLCDISARNANMFTSIQKRNSFSLNEIDSSCYFWDRVRNRYRNQLRSVYTLTSKVHLNIYDMFTNPTKTLRNLLNPPVSTFKTILTLWRYEYFNTYINRWLRQRVYHYPDLWIFISLYNIRIEINICRLGYHIFYSVFVYMREISLFLIYIRLWISPEGIWGKIL